MRARAQAGLEYLMTYGWALVVVATIAGMLVFIVSSPSGSVDFSSSEPTKMVLKGGLVSSGLGSLIVQNVTGGKIDVQSVHFAGDFADGGSAMVNGTLRTELNANPPLEVPAGGEIYLEDFVYAGSGEVDGEVDIYYTDAFGFEQMATVKGRGSTAPNGTPLTACNTALPGGVYYLESSVEVVGSNNCFVFASDDTVVNCEGKSVTSSYTSGYAFYANHVDNVSVSNCVIDGFQYGIRNYFSPDCSYSYNDVSGASSTGIYSLGGHRANIKANNSTANTGVGLSVVASLYPKVNGNKTCGTLGSFDFICNGAPTALGAGNVSSASKTLNNCPGVKVSLTC